MATNTTNTSASNTSGVTPKKKTGKRRMKKQVRRTLGGLFLASAIAVAAIPVESTSAKNKTISHTEDANTNIVRAVHYKNADNSSFEKIPGQTTEADASWQSKVPYIEVATFDNDGHSVKRSSGDAIYVDEDMSFQFAFVQESAIATDYYAVLVGVTNSAISTSGALTIPDTVDAYLQYTANTTRGGYCAVNREGKFLYYSTSAQIHDDILGDKYTTFHGTQKDYDDTVLPSDPLSFGGIDNSTAKTVAVDELWSLRDTLSIVTVPSNAASSGYVDEHLHVGDQAYAYPYVEFTASSNTPVIDYDVDGITVIGQHYEGTWGTKTAYYPITPVMERTYAPCYLNNKDTWIEKEQNDTLYYWNGDDSAVNLKDNTGKFISISTTTDPMKQRIHDAVVRYIGMQKVVSVDNTIKNDANEDITITNWTVTEPTTVTSDAGVLTETPSNGVFYGNANLRSLTIGSQLAGIGDYAFYRCTALDSVTFSSQLNSIGNGAFKGCNNLNTVNLDPWTNLTVIGASAFEGCAGLRSIDIPVAVTAIGDRAFKDCATAAGGIQNIYMCGEHANSPSVNMNLKDIGFNAFENDQYLDYLEFPASLAQKMPVHYLSGCTRLNYIKSNNPSFDVIDGDYHLDTDYGAAYPDYGTYDASIENGVKDSNGNYTTQPKFHHGTKNADGTYSNGISTCDIDDWLKSLENENFYFESYDNYVLHQTAKDHSAAFNYDDAGKEDWYEIVMVCDESPAHESTYVVDSNNNLVNVDIDKDCSVITIPGSIGGHGVTSIAEGSFTDNCSLEKIYIPYSVESIATNAFRGCHNLQTVYFTEPYNYDLVIGEGAFDTQSGVSSHAVGCPSIDASHPQGKLDDNPKLSFIGAIDGSYAPYAYAMNSNNNINVGSQPITYITYYSGWPTFLQVEYNPQRDSGMENELVAYPTKAYLTKLKAAWDTSPEDALKAYPFMSREDFANLTHAINGWTDDTFPTGYKQDEVVCANSVYDLEIPFGVESIKPGLFSNLDSDGKVISDVSLPFDSTQNYSIGDYCTQGGTKYMFIKDHPAGAWDADDVALLTGVNELGANSVLQSVALDSIVNIEPYTFAGIKSLKTVDITSNQSIGDYAFYGDTALEDVTVSGDTSTIGIRPFRDCSSLKGVNFNGNNFVCEDAIIYGLSSGSKNSVVECLETRGQNFGGQFNGNTTVSASELANITSIQPEAFMNCDHIETVELNDSSVQTIPERTFAATDDLYLVSLPQSLKNIKKDAFLDSNIRQVSIPNVVTQIQDSNVFAQTENGYPGAATYDEFLSGYQSDHDSAMTGTDYVSDVTAETKKNELNPYVDSNKVNRNVTFYTPEESAASIYADDHPYITSTATAIMYKVTFKDPKITGDDKTYWTTEVASGECAENPPKGSPTHDGTTFVGWLSSADGEAHTDVSTIPILGTTNYTAQYEGGNCTVTFYDKNNEIIKTQEVAYGQAVSPPSAPHVDGYEFKEWKRFPISSETGFDNITTDTTFTAYYEKVDSSDKHHVVFYNYDDSIVSEQYIADGEAAQTPSNPSRDGYTFTGWKPADFTNITKDLDVYAQFEKNASNGGGNGGNNNGNNNGNNSGNNGGSSSGNSSGNKTSSGNSSSGNSSKAKTYTVTVINGSGSGTYEEGASVVIAANEPAKGKAFDKWTTADVSLVSTSLSATSFKMPGKNVTVTANYKDAPSSSSSTVKYATGNSGRPPATGRTATGTTQVQVNKGGVSNIDLASATVRGSTDSFIVKVTETNEATNLVENALNNRFGGLDAIKYWPCDISLYDSTGNTKITDTTGLTVDITLPIPDELRQYGGNNKVAAVSNGQLEELSTRFNTVNGTPTVTFTATHFSPYVIYADTNNLVASEMLDASPKTGDPIHPKWFLAIALAAGSVFMFLKKDKKPAVATA